MDEKEKQVDKKTPRISVDWNPGRWGKVFHIFDPGNREIVLEEKDATYVATGSMEEILPGG
jgi:hypothetical protein